MRAVILAGGKGTRLGSLARDIPKPMLEIGGIAILEHQIRLLRRYGLRDVTLITGHLGEVIEAHFGDGSKHGVRIAYYRETQPLGTTGGLCEIEAQLEDDFLLFYGDVMLDMDLRRLINFHHAKQGLCTLVLHPNDHPYDSDLVEIDSERRVTAFHAKPHEKDRFYRNLVNAAVYVMSPGILQHLKRGEKEDFGRDVFPRIYRDEPLYGYLTAEYIKDVGTPERVAQVDRDCRSGKIARLNREQKRKAIFLDRDGVLNVYKGLLHRVEDFELAPDAAAAVQKINRSECLAIVVTNQPVVARGLCSLDEVEEIHKKMETLLGEQGAFLDAVYFCPHHPDKGYPEENADYKIDCNCRKPKTGMVEAAAGEYNIDLANSFLIGDSERDVMCAKNAGLTAIGVRTGEGCRQTRVEPDFFFENLSEAVDFVIDCPLESALREVLERSSQREAGRPWVVSVGGNSRSGKTTFSDALARAFERRGERVLLVRLDNWILSIEERREEHDVFGRFQMDLLASDARKILTSGAVVRPRYDARTEKPREEEIVYRLDNHQVVILEGVVALSSPALRRMADLKVFCDVADEPMRSRIRRYYQWKGFEEEQIDQILQSRTRDEYERIKEDKQFSDLVVRLEWFSK